MPDRTRTVQWSDPLLTAQGATGKTGRAFLQAIIDGELPPAPIQYTLGFRLAEVGDGMTRFTGTFAEYMYNPMMGVHGGMLCTLLDSCMGAAVMSALDAQHGYTTVDLNVHLTRPVTANTGDFVAEGHVVHRGSRIMTAEGKLFDTAGKLLAHASTTCLVVER
ncbi:MAG: PaaI family thioesterase [Kofleriaceae bacterium]|nr:PaaI family thioesterase [Kofleriaceae bacterium]